MTAAASSLEISQLFDSTDPARLLYCLQAVMAALMPADDARETGILDRSGRTQFGLSFVRCGGLTCMLQLLQASSLSATDAYTPKICNILLKISKYVLAPSDG